MTTKPVFFKAVDAPDASILEVCEATEKVGGIGCCLGAQRISGLWRVYLKSSVARIELLSKGLVLKGKKVGLLGRNPFIVTGVDGNEVPMTKLFIGGVPISFCNQEIVKYLKLAGVNILDKIDMETVRRPNGQLTTWQTGRRTCWIELPKVPLARNMEMGIFTGVLYYREMKALEVCFNCKQKGHRAYDCRRQVICRFCRKEGHKEAECLVKKEQERETSENGEADDFVGSEEGSLDLYSDQNDEVLSENNEMNNDGNETLDEERMDDKGDAINEIGEHKKDDLQDTSQFENETECLSEEEQNPTQKEVGKDEGKKGKKSKTGKKNSAESSPNPQKSPKSPTDTDIKNGECKTERGRKSVKGLVKENKANGGIADYFARSGSRKRVKSPEAPEKNQRQKTKR